jgi:hypothetical protein
VSDKEIAKEILLKSLEFDYLHRDEFPDTSTAVDMICESYKKNS